MEGELIGIGETPSDARTPRTIRMCSVDARSMKQSLQPNLRVSGDKVRSALMDPFSHSEEQPPFIGLSLSLRRVEVGEEVG